MRKISTWAKLHPYQARTYIILIKILLIGLAIVTGNIIAATGVRLSPLFAVISGIILILTAISYPKKSAKGFYRRKTYAFRKSLDFILGFTTFILFSALIANYKVVPGNSPLPVAAATSINKGDPPTAKEILASLKYRDKNSLTKQEKRILKKEFSRQVGIYAKAKLSGDPTAGDVLLVILTIIGAVGLTFLLAVLACNVACSGADGLAIAIMALGLTGIIIGTIAIIKKIKRRHNKKPAQETAVPATQ